MMPLRRIAPKAESTPSPPGGGIAKRRHIQHSTVEWDDRRDMIIRLYTQEKKTAKAVLAALKNDASSPFLTR